MQFVTQGAVDFHYTIPAKSHALSSGLRYHLEVYHTATCEKTMFSGPVVTPAEAPSVGNVLGVPGLAVFSNVPLPEEGIYVMTVYYADNDDLNAANVKTFRQGGATVYKVNPVSVVVA